MLLVFLLLKIFIVLLIWCLRFLKYIMLLNVLIEFKIWFVWENVWIKLCIFNFLFIYIVLSVVVLNLVKNILIMISRLMFLFLIFKFKFL